MKRIDRLLSKLEGDEDKFLRSQFIAPVVKGGTVRVRIAGIVCKLAVKNKGFAGWALLRPLSHSEAEIVGKPSLSQIREYLALLPEIRIIICERREAMALGVPANFGRGKIKIEGMVPVHLAEGIGIFDHVLTRFDGNNFWFEAIDARRDPSVADYLRKSLKQMLAPHQLRKPTLTPEERAAYRWLFTLEEEKNRDKTEARLSGAIEHAGGELESFIDLRDSYQVRFTVDGAQHVSAIRKDDLTVLSAGICLSGEDAKFDLQSLVGVLREYGEEESW